MPFLLPERNSGQLKKMEYGCYLIFWLLFRRDGIGDGPIVCLVDVLSWACQFHCYMEENTTLKFMFVLLDPI